VPVLHRKREPGLQVVFVVGEEGEAAAFAFSISVPSIGHVQLCSAFSSEADAVASEDRDVAVGSFCALSRWCRCSGRTSHRLRATRFRFVNSAAHGHASAD
jgi:hypothetical protein